MSVVFAIVSNQVQCTRRTGRSALMRRKCGIAKPAGVRGGWIVKPNVKVTGRQRQDGSARAGETVPRTTGQGAAGLPLALRLTDKLGVPHV